MWVLCRGNAKNRQFSFSVDTFVNVLAEVRGNQKFIFFYCNVAEKLQAKVFEDFSVLDTKTKYSGRSF